MLTIRLAHPDDAALLTSLILELAEYDGLGGEAAVTEEDVARDAFGPKPKFRALIAEWEGQVAGYACFFEIYSTFQGHAGIFLDDIFVRPAFRNKGIGKALLARVAKIAWEEDYFCVRWETLAWNSTGIEFFQKTGSVILDEWKSGLLIGDDLEAMAQLAP